MKIITSITFFSFVDVELEDTQAIPLCTSWSQLFPVSFILVDVISCWWVFIFFPLSGVAYAIIHIGFYLHELKFEFLIPDLKLPLKWRPENFQELKPINKRKTKIVETLKLETNFLLNGRWKLYFSLHFSKVACLLSTKCLFEKITKSLFLSKCLFR